VELSKFAEVSIVRTQPLAAGQGGSYGLSKDEKKVTHFAMEATELLWPLTRTQPEIRWNKGIDMLPAGFFKIAVKGLPKDMAAVHQDLVTAYESSFGINIKTAEYAWDGVQVTAPAKLPAVFRKTSSVDSQKAEEFGGGEFSTQSFGYAFRETTMAELTKEIENRLQMPVDLIHGFGTERFDFDVKCNTVDYDGLLYGLRKLGFDIEPKKLTRKTTVITPAK
jgi:hypothetical protein